MPADSAAPYARVDSATLPTAAVTLSGRVAAVSPAFAALLDAPVGSRLADSCLDDGDRAAVTALLAAAAQGTEGGELELGVRSADGSPLRATFAWQLGRDGAHVTLVCPASSGEARLRALLAHAAQTAWTADEAGLVTSATGGVLESLGLTVPEVVGRSAFSFIHPEDLPRFRSAWDRVVAGTSRQELLEVRAQLSDGGWMWVRETLTDLRSDPHVRAIAGWASDITDLRREAELLQVYEEQFRARFETARVPQALLDPSGLLSAANPAFTELLGRDLADLRGKALSAVTSPADSGDADRAIAMLLQGTCESVQVERLVLHADGRPIPVISDLAVLHDRDGRPAGIAVFWHDLTVQRAFERLSAQQQAFFDALTASANELALVIDAQGRLLFVSPAIRRLLGYEARDLLMRECWDFVHSEDLALTHATLGEILSEGGTRTVLARVIAADGSWHTVESTATNLLDTSVGGIVVNLRDITERLEAEEQLRVSEARYRAIADTAAEGIVAVAPDGAVLYANAQMAEILGYAGEDLVGRLALSLVDEDAARRFRQQLSVRDKVGVEHYQAEIRRPDGELRCLAVSSSPLRTDDGRFEAALAMVSDVTEARRNEERLRHAALHDDLTGLPNRVLLLDRLEHALARDIGTTAVLFIDLDQFKHVNDSRGHAIGDDLLVVAARRLAAAVGPADTVARFGGDEFVVLAEDVGAPEAVALAHALLASFAEPVELAGGPVHFGASIGVAVGPPGTASDLLRYADTAMYAAKAAGRGRVRQFDQGLAEEVELGFALAADLRVAVAENELRLAYQPIVDLESGAVLGMEALARWEHPVHGPVSPARFVKTAEISGFALDLDRWVLRRALADTVALRKAEAVPPAAYVAVNLSARNLTDRGFEEFVIAAVAESALAPTDLVLEITEGAIMEDASTAIALLQRLRSHGFGIAIDDFGTGYSSLAYLRDLPITLLKIDRSFVSGITAERDALAIAASIVDLARAVGVAVTAEGVETREQAALLRQLGCGSGQGWLWCKAMPPGEVRDWSVPRDPLPAATTRAPAARRRREVRREHGLDVLLAMHSQGASLSTIAAALNKEGYRTPTGRRWHAATIADTITRSAYPSLGDE